jgi:alpha-amylase/alpha-mannosidase (GH57 family)
MRWLEPNAPATYARIQEADRRHLDRWGVGNALTQPTHHAILPLCKPRDQALLVRWGILSHEHRFGHTPAGLWLPNLAVTLDVLQVLYDQGVKFTVLGQAQVDGAQDGAGPYWVRLPSGDRIAAYVRDDNLSNTVAFAIRTLGGAGRWARNVLVPLKKNYGRLLLLALEGETFGYHYPGEENFLHWLLDYEAVATGYNVTTLARDLQEHPPQAEITVREHTAWNSTRELTRWRGALRQAFDHLANRLDDVYLSYAQGAGAEPWRLREEYLRVRLGQITEAQLMQRAGPKNVTIQQATDLLSLLQAQFHRQRMYTSSAFFYEDLDRSETRLAIADAVRAIRLAQSAAGADLLTEFRSELAEAVSNQSDRNAAQILDEVLAWERESAPARARAAARLGVGAG